MNPLSPLQSGKKLVDVTGIEPVTPCLQIGGEPFLMEYDDLLCC
jgi:hypothetical protein